MRHSHYNGLRDRVREGHEECDKAGATVEEGGRFTVGMWQYWSYDVIGRKERESLWHYWDLGVKHKL